MPEKITDITVFPERLSAANGYWKYATREFGDFLENYLRVFEKHREQLGIVPTETQWKQLPFENKHPDWKWRRQSLAVLSDEIGAEQFDTVLEIGAWNGWLTKQLARQSRRVIAADYFAADFDGIGNIGAFGPNIVPVQCNLETVSEDFKPASFDLIVVNHCISYTKNPTEYLKKLTVLLKPDAKIIALGCTFFGNAENKIKKNRAAAATFSEKYDLPLYIGAVKGYMDLADREILQNADFKISKYRGMWKQHLAARFNNQKPVYIALVYKRKTPK